MKEEEQDRIYHRILEAAKKAKKGFEIDEEVIEEGERYLKALEEEREAYKAEIWYCKKKIEAAKELLESINKSTEEVMK